MEGVHDMLGCQTNAGRTFHTCCSPRGPSPSFYGAFKCQSGVCLCFSRALRNPGRCPSCRSTAHPPPKKTTLETRSNTSVHTAAFFLLLPSSVHSSLVFFLTFNSAPPPFTFSILSYRSAFQALPEFSVVRHRSSRNACCFSPGDGGVKASQLTPTRRVPV